MPCVHYISREGLILCYSLVVILSFDIFILKHYYETYVQMRLNKVSELIHNSTNHQNLDSARVSVHFQEIIDLVIILFLLGIIYFLTALSKKFLFFVFPYNHIPFVGYRTTGHLKLFREVILQ